MTPMKTRFSPSPTGQMHLGNVRTALFSFLLARRYQGSFLLRIEDSDKVRSRSEFTELLKQDLNWLGFSWDEGPFFQSQRESVYQAYYDLLEKNHLAYPCFCTDEQLSLSRKIQLSSGKPPRYAGTCRSLTETQIEAKKQAGFAAALRFKVPLGEKIIFEDFVKGPQYFKSEDIGDFIIRRADGSASFFFCNAVDDSLMGVTHALRGEDHLTNTPRQLMILNALALRQPLYGHLPLILSGEGDKLSKREGSQHLESLCHHGYLPVAVNNYLARLGHYYEQTHLMSLSELIHDFSLSRIGKTPAHFDEGQLLHWQKLAVTALDDQNFWNWIESFYPEIRLQIPEEKQRIFAGLMRSNILFPREVLYWTEVFYQPIVFDEAAKIILNQTEKKFFDSFLECVVESSHTDQYGDIIKIVSEKSGLKGKALFQPLRIILTGVLKGPELQEIFTLLGKEKIIEKIHQAKIFLKYT